MIDWIIPVHDGLAKFRELGIAFKGSRYEQIRKIRNTIFRLFFNPVESLCNSINAFSASLENEHRVGFQVRMGGTLAFTQEKKAFLKEDDIVGFFLQLDKVKEAIRKKTKRKKQHDHRITHPSSLNGISTKEDMIYMNHTNHTKTSYSLFVSTDSYQALERIQKELGEVVQAAPFFHRGHSSINHLSRSRVPSSEVLKGTFFDLFILKDCNILISTFGSSFGNLAFEMGLDNPLQFEPKGAMGKCTVYNRPSRTRVQYQIKKRELPVCWSLPNQIMFCKSRLISKSLWNVSQRAFHPVGIVGLPNVGKSTLFNALTKSELAEMANYPFCTIDPNKADILYDMTDVD